MSKMSRQREEVLGYVREIGADGDVTGSEVNLHFRDLALAQDPPDHKKANGAPRTSLNDLYMMGLLSYGTRRVCKVTGLKCRTYKLTTAGSETHGVAVPAKPEQRTKTHRRAKDERAKDMVRECVDTLIDALTEDIEADERARLRKRAQAEQSRIFSFIHADVETSRKRAARNTTVDVEHQAILDRQAYERALAFYAVKVKPGEFASDKDWMFNYRDKVRTFHPDRNGGAVDPTFTRAVEAHQTIVDFHDRYKPKRPRKREVRHVEQQR
jgi:hypothetical protein